LELGKKKEKENEARKKRNLDKQHNGLKEEGERPSSRSGRLLGKKKGKAGPTQPHPPTLPETEKEGEVIKNSGGEGGV